MSNWLDVRIKLYSEKAEIEQIAKKFKDYFYKSTKHDPNTSVMLGSTDYKFIWCAIKSFDDFNSIVCHTKVGMDEYDAAKICKWLFTKFPDIKKIDIQIRDDGSKIFSLFQWAYTMKNTLKCRKIDPMQYPDMSDGYQDSYTEEASKRISTALKNSGFTNVISLDKQREPYPSNE